MVKDYSMKSLLGFSRPFGIGFGPDDTLWVTDFNANEVACFDRETLAPRGAIDCTTFKGPHSVTFDSFGRLYVTEFPAQRVQKISYDRKSAETIIASSQLVGPATGFMSSANELFVADFSGNCVSVFNMKGASLRKLKGAFNKPHQVGFDHEGNIYATDTHYHRIVKYDKSENVTAIFSKMEEPTAIAVGYDYFWLGHYGGRVSKWTLDGTHIRDLEEPFSHVYDVKVHNDVLYVADSDNGAIKIFTFDKS